jgi:predicted AAA+ superfamily ATPase
MRNTSISVDRSHSIDIKKSIERLPGRRGEGEETLDKILLPMKFAEFAETVNPSLKVLFDKEQLRSNHKRQEIIQGLFEGKIDPVVRTLQVYQEDLNTLFTNI